MGTRVSVLGPTRNPTTDVAGLPNRFCISVLTFVLGLQPLATFAALFGVIFGVQIHVIFIN